MHDHHPGVISNCYATGNVIVSGSNAGGFCGICDSESTITNCYAVGDATAGGQFAGGFVGVTSDADYATNGVVRISESYALENATTQTSSYGGGFVGRHQDAAVIERCFARGNATSATVYAGGVAGGMTYLASVIQQSYSMGNAYAASNYPGGFIGLKQGGRAVLFDWRSEFVRSKCGRFCRL